MWYNDSINKGDIKILKDGTWTYKGAEIIRKDILNLFYKHLEKNEKGKIVLNLDGEKVEIIVEDVPFIVKDIDIIKDPKGDIDSIILTLNDGTKEPLDINTLRINKDNVLYCDVKGGFFSAKFKRPLATYLADFLDEDEKGVYLKVKGRKFFIPNVD
ncbi:MAG: hypothetical protein DRG20_06620 [Deltaproteobacteria bacterium]|nr:DUF1285 domain-containing protein [Deltaproteobacteria bacterium]RLA88088.1 MAG: hypothetical protein DRG20_06620 [Deltaproteobacteria bacterium]